MTKLWVRAIGLLAMLLTLSVGVLAIFFANLASDVSSGARVPAVRVLAAEMWARASGGYWDAAFLERSGEVKALSQAERVSFFRVIALNCDLDTSRAVLFLEVLSSDRKALLQDLISKRGGKDHTEYTTRQRMNLDKWIEILSSLEQNQIPY
jgi:hypothetical protein